MVQRQFESEGITNFPHFGYIIEVNLDPVVGSEIGKRRPAIVVSNDMNNQYAQTITIVPLTSQSSKKSYPFQVLLPKGAGGLPLESTAKCNQIRTIDKSRIAATKDKLPHSYLEEVEKALEIHLNLS